jgi:hypothetical protein
MMNHAFPRIREAQAFHLFQLLARGSNHQQG